MTPVDTSMVRGQLGQGRLGGVSAWLFVALFGQWVFLWFLLVQYGGNLLTGHIDAWAKSSVIGHAPGDTTGNLVFASHVLVAAVMSFGGALQLIPQIRKHLPLFHRWNGRAFIAAAVIAAIGGLHLTWVRGAVTAGAIGITLNAVLLLWFAVAALYFARARRFVEHRRWAMRAFLVGSGVWFFRVMLFGWILINQAPVGIGANFDGPAVWIISFACYLLPLALLELYFVSERWTSRGWRRALSATFGTMALLTATGVTGAFLIAWRPFL